MGDKKVAPVVSLFLRSTEAKEVAITVWHPAVDVQGLLIKRPEYCPDLYQTEI